jgi:hypothetical protein
MANGKKNGTSVTKVPAWGTNFPVGISLGEGIIHGSPPLSPMVPGGNLPLDPPIESFLDTFDFSSIDTGPSIPSAPKVGGMRDPGGALSALASLFGRGRPPFFPSKTPPPRDLGNLAELFGGGWAPLPSKSDIKAQQLLDDALRRASVSMEGMDPQGQNLAARASQASFDETMARIRQAITDETLVAQQDKGILEDALSDATAAASRAVTDGDLDTWQEQQPIVDALTALKAEVKASDDRLHEAGIVETAAATRADEAAALQAWRAAQEQATRDWQAEQSQNTADAQMLGVLIPLLFQAQQRQATEREALIQEQQTKAASDQFAELAQQFFPNIDAASLQGIDPSLMMLLFSLMQQSGQGQVSGTPRTIYA